MKNFNHKIVEAIHTIKIMWPDNIQVFLMVTRIVLIPALFIIMDLRVIAYPRKLMIMRLLFTCRTNVMFVNDVMYSLLIIDLITYISFFNRHIE